MIVMATELNFPQNKSKIKAVTDVNHSAAKMTRFVSEMIGNIDGKKGEMMVTTMFSELFFSSRSLKHGIDV